MWGCVACGCRVCLGCVCAGVVGECRVWVEGCVAWVWVGCVWGEGVRWCVRVVCGVWGLYVRVLCGRVGECVWCGVGGVWGCGVWGVSVCVCCVLWVLCGVGDVAGRGV